MADTPTHRPVNAGPRTLREIAADIRAAWGDKLDTTGYAAKPYLEALECVDTVEDMYGQDKAVNLVRYFLSNAAQFKGDRARVLKEELRAQLPTSR